MENAHCPSVRHLWADSGYTGALIDWARCLFEITIDIVAKHAGQVGFVVLHRRWVVERSLAWTNQHHRCVRDYERLPEHHETILRWPVIHTISKRLKRFVFGSVETEQRGEVADEGSQPRHFGQAPVVASIHSRW